MNGSRFFQNPCMDADLFLSLALFRLGSIAEPSSLLRKHGRAGASHGLPTTMTHPCSLAQTYKTDCFSILFEYKFARYKLSTKNFVNLIPINLYLKTLLQKFGMMDSPNAASYSNHTNSGFNIIILSPFAYTNPTAASEYDAATISSIVFGIFMALLASYKIWQNGIWCIGTQFRPK